MIAKDSGSKILKIVEIVDPLSLVENISIFMLNRCAKNSVDIKVIEKIITGKLEILCLYNPYTPKTIPMRIAFCPTIYVILYEKIDAIT
jgi:hypothetical protein